MTPQRWLGGRVAVGLVAQDAGRGPAAGRLVAALLGRPERDVVLRRAPGGKPLLDAPAGAACSFAHRGGVSMAGAAAAGTLGVDLEWVRDDLDVAGIARTFFAPAEADWLAGLPPDRRPPGFTALWCAKEAALKASGRGIAGGLARPVVDGGALLPLLAGAATARFTLPDGLGLELRPIRLRGRAAIGCVAWAAPGWTAPGWTAPGWTAPPG